MNIYRKVIMK